MRQFTLEQYQKMAFKFNKMGFSDKIKIIKENNDILTLASDYNWWAVKVKDKDIQEELYETETGFDIENEWGYNEMQILVSILGIGITDI